MTINLNDEIKHLLDDYQGRHSDFQIDNFIVGKEASDWAQYKQALREIDSRYTTLIGQKEELELFDLNRSWRFSFGRRAAIIKERRQRQRQALADDIRETERELNRFVELALELRKQIGEIDEDKRRLLEADSWLQKARKMAGVDMIVNGGTLTKPTIEMILALPRREQRAVLSEISTRPEPFALLGL